MLDFLRSRKEKALRQKVVNAIKANKPEELRMLLSKNKAQKRIRKTGGNVLFRCLIEDINHRHYKCFAELRDANSCNVGECSPVMSQITHEGEVRILKLLLEYGVNPNSDSGRSFYNPLYFALTLGDLTSFKILLHYGADPDYNCSQPDFLGIAPDVPSLLGMCLARNYEVQFVKLLIQFGANMYLPDIQEVRIQVDNDAAKLLDREIVHPRSLMSQCRMTIRRLMKQVGKLGLIDRLEVPDELVRYLQYQDEMDNPEKLPRYYEERYQEFCYFVAYQ